VWGGKVELHSLELNIDAVNAEIDRQAIQAPNLALPFRVVDGRFDSLEVDVPWTHLLSQPLKFRAKGLTVSVAPVDHATSSHIAQTSAENEAGRIQEARKQSIATANDYRLQANALSQLAADDLEGNKKGENKGLAASLFRRIIENLQIEISDVHITLLGAEASAGVVLESLRIFTTDEAGQETYVVRTATKGTTFLHKSLVIRGLGAYIDEKATKDGHLAAIGEDDGDGDETKRGENHNYILAPLSFQAKLRQADGNVCINFCKYLFESELSALSILLSKTQLELVRKIQNQMEPAVDVARPLFPEYRPLHPLTRQTAREWWKYAYRCVGRLNGRRSWVEFFRAFQLRNEYVELYKRHAFASGNTWIAPLTEKDRVRLNEIESDRSISIEGLMTWRSIADARARKEMEKRDSRKAKSSIFKSLFGSSDESKSADDEPPITLSADELKELETLTLQDVRTGNSELSKDSKLCDLSFVLGSFKIHLITGEMLPLCTLNMGKVSTSFSANADGSFLFDTMLQSLAISDSITPHTFFPEILSSHMDQDHLSESPCFLMNVSKTNTGDQKLLVKLRPFEMVAPPMLVKELVKFVSIEGAASPPQILNEINPVLRQSLSGSVDLFYDASEGVDLSIDKAKKPPHPAIPKVESDFSGAIFDAWKAKTESNRIWVIDLDLAAPVIIVPENCSKLNASVLVLNLGRFTLRYGDIQSSPRVKSWFAANPYPDVTADCQYDYGSVQISSLLFSIGMVQNWKVLARSEGSPDSVLAPITAQMDFGIESHSSRPRAACFVVLPLIAGSLSANQLSKFLAVSHTWQQISDTIGNNQQVSEKMDNDEQSQRSTSTSGSKQVVSASKRANELLLSLGTEDTKVYSTIHLEMNLKRLSATLSFEEKGIVEANLVSVSVRATTSSDGNAKLQLSMGWFWVLDRLQSDFARSQRLFAHSALPLSADDYAHCGEYSILSELEKRGVFSDSFRSTDLADIVVQHSPKKRFGSRDPFVAEEYAHDGFAVDTIIDARFTTLFMNWNPYAVKTLVAGLESFQRLSSAESESERGIAIITHDHNTRKQIDDAGIMTSQDEAADVCILIRAELDSAELILRSALDDLPLFTLSMTETKSSMVIASGRDNGLLTNFSLGNLRAISSQMGSTCSSYGTVLGVSPGRSESLLSVRYWDGPRGIQQAAVDDGIESYGIIQLSPMRMVYIQAQALALINYTTEGILGAITAAAATSAAAAAADIAAAGSDKKQFVVRATGFEVVVPEAAYTQSAMSIRTGEMLATYDAFPFPGGGEATVSLTGVMMLGQHGRQLLKYPSDLTLKVIVPVEEVGSAEDQAIRTVISMGSAAFCLEQSQYRQLLTLLDKNFGDEELYLRPQGPEYRDQEHDVVSASGSREFFTHAGNLVTDNPRRLYATVTLGGLSVSLFSDHDVPLVTLTADETRINIDIFPEEDRFAVAVTMKNLECTDDRTRSIDREYRSLIYQEEDPGATSPASIMSLQYETRKDLETRIKVSIGTPHVVFIPDVISDILNFLSAPGTGDANRDPSPQVTPSSKIEIETQEEGFETTLAESTTEKVSTFSISLLTSKCCIVFVDLGASGLIQPHESRDWFVEAATETVVIKGILDCSVHCAVNNANEVVSASAQFHGDGFEAYTAFGGSTDALQVLEPVKVSMYVNRKMTPDGVAEVDARLATVTAVDLCISMKNIALFNAIISGISDCLTIYQDDEPDIVMTQQDADRIEKLDTLLEGDRGSIGTISRASSIVDSSSKKKAPRSTLSSKLTLPQISITIVNDLQGLDDALFRVGVQNVVFCAVFDEGVRDHRMKSPYMAFSTTLNCSITADYYDESSRRWETLLLKPWEITLRAQRGMNSKLTARVPSTSCDIESFACQMGFTEQFLVSLASANRMWTLYSAAMTSEQAQSDRLRRAIAARAARTLVTVLPYAIENHCGKDLQFVVHGGHETNHVCADKTIEYFRFPQPKGNGFGGKRLYGQDRLSRNSLSISVGSYNIRLADVDSVDLDERQSHVLPSNEVIIVQVQREGKTTVSFEYPCVGGIEVFARICHSLRELRSFMFQAV
jgi:hypothetical protein